MANQTELLNVSDEMKLDDDRQNFCEELGAEELCSSSLDTFEELYSSSATDACGNSLPSVKNRQMATKYEGQLKLYVYAASRILGVDEKDITTELIHLYK